MINKLQFTLYIFSLKVMEALKNTPFSNFFIKNFGDILRIKKKDVCACHYIVTSKNAFTTHIDSI